MTVQVKGGVVHLSGLVASDILKEDLQGAIKQIEGVKGVNCQFYIHAQYYGP